MTVKREICPGEGMPVFTAETDENVEELRILPAGGEDGIELFKIQVRFGKAGVCSPVRLTWHAHMKGLLNFWCPTSRTDHTLRQWYAARKCESRFYEGAPVISVFRNGGENYMTCAVSEAELPVTLSASVNDFDEKEELDFRLVFFEKAVPAEAEYALTLRLDRRALPFTDCVGDTVLWWRGFYPNDRQAGGTCDRPMYSTWYSFHQNPQQTSLEKEVDLAADLGLKALIIDDGWSYPGPGTGDYINCGTWHVEESKFPDFRAFTEYAHKKGLKVALWFPVPFVGKNNPDYARFADKLVCYSDRFSAGILDPRYPEVRAYIVDGYRKMAEEYGIDGLKLDFIDVLRYAPFAGGVFPACEGGDCETLEEAIAVLLGEVERAFRAEDPDFLIEFRQNYVGPSITRFCNMLRVDDCAFDSFSNRLGMADLRMMNYPLAVHADMFLWAHDEEPRECARMLLNSLFEVPQISVRLASSTPDQLRVIRNYVSYWDDHRELLLHARIHVTDPECDYTSVSAEDETLRITCVYVQRPVRADGKPHDVFNASDEDVLYVDAAFPARYMVYDCFGDRISDGVLPQGLNRIAVPAGGRLEIR
ncbi:MAG: alpha-galactosidase [Clostridia bacterium]|nr:alpha-galactosidase [Clostridia bacterium]